MKTSIQIIAILALAGSVGLAEGDRKREGNGNGPRKNHNPAKLIEHLDKDGNGSVSKAEFLASERAKENPERAERAFGHLDADGNGEITAEEFAKHKPQGGRGDGDRPNPAEIFKRLDKDGNGSISKQEFTSGERAQRNPEMAAKLFDKLDADGNGEISRDEFAKRPKRDPQREGGPDERPPGRGPAPQIE